MNEDNFDMLLPCPFCGAAPIIEPWHGGWPTRRMISCINEDCHPSPQVVGETAKKAAEIWNKRAELTDQASLIKELDKLKYWVNDLQSGMYVNCVYCGHRYGPQDKVPASMADVLKQHIAHCEKHPMNALRSAIEKIYIYVRIREWERTDADSMDDQEQLDSAEELISEITLIAAKALEAA